MRRGAAFDVQAVCSGFIYALAVADNFMRMRPGEDRAGDRRRDLLAHPRLAGPRHLRAVRRRRRRGGAARRRRRTAAPHERGILSTHLHSDGSGYDLLYVDGGPSTTGTAGLLRMEGKEVFRHAVHAPRRGGRRGAGRQRPRRRRESTGWCRTRPTAASSTAWRKKLGLAAEKVVVTIDRHANTSAASVPLALAEAAGDGRHQARATGAAGGDGRRLHLGRGLVRW